MAAYPYLVQTCWDVTNELIRQWQDRPHLWERERDIQTELAARLQNVARLLGRDTVTHAGRSLVRVTCEPPIYYQFTDGKEYRCYPDVTMRNDSFEPDMNSPPYLWICEIKYDPYQPSQWDVDKLRFLVEQGHSLYGCWLNLSRQHAVTGNGIEWERSSHDKVWICQARLVK